jgi:hypothetical protein
MGPVAGSRADRRGRDPVGREAELAFLRGRLEEILKGISRTVLLEGAAGVGRTALWRPFLARAGRQVVVRTSGAELEAGLAHGVMEQLVAEMRQPLTERLATLGTEQAADVEPSICHLDLVGRLGRGTCAGDR